MSHLQTFVICVFIWSKSVEIACIKEITPSIIVEALDDSGYFTKKDSGSKTRLPSLWNYPAAETIGETKKFHRRSSPNNVLMLVSPSAILW